MPANPTPEELAAWRVLCEKAGRLWDPRKIGWNEDFDTIRTALPRLINALEAAERARAERELVVNGYTQGLLEKDEEIEKLGKSIAAAEAKVKRLLDAACSLQDSTGGFVGGKADVFKSGVSAVIKALEKDGL